MAAVARKHAIVHGRSSIHSSTYRKMNGAFIAPEIWESRWRILLGFQTSGCLVALLILLRFLLTEKVTRSYKTLGYLVGVSGMHMLGLLGLGDIDWN